MVLSGDIHHVSGTSLPYKHPLCLLCRALSGDVAFLLHRVFMRSISVLGSDKQIAKWIPLATQHRLIGSYAQTELGHGKAAGKTAFLYDTAQIPMGI